MMGIFEGDLHQKDVFLLGKYNFTTPMIQIEWKTIFPLFRKNLPFFYLQQATTEK